MHLFKFQTDDTKYVHVYIWHTHTYTHIHAHTHLHTYHISKNFCMKNISDKIISNKKYSKYFLASENLIIQIKVRLILLVYVPRSD